MRSMMPTIPEMGQMGQVDNGITDDNGSSNNDNTECEINTSEQPKVEVIASKETKAVWYMRLILLIALICSALLVSLSLYFYLANDEKKDFEDQFNSDAAKILEGIGSSLDGTLGAMDAYISEMVAQTKLLNTTFPFVAVPGFGVQSAKLLKLSRAYQFGVAFFVTPEERTQWEQFAKANDGWIDDTIQVQNNNEEWWGPTLQNYQSSETIFQVNEEGIIPAGDPLPYMNNYLVSWQLAPLIEGLHNIPYNYDQWGGEPTPDYLESVSTKTVVIAKSPNIVRDPDDAEQVQYNKELAEINKLYVHPDQDPSEPLTAIIYPIIDSLNSLRIDTSKDDPVVGLLVFAIYWRELVTKILPSNSLGLAVVFDASCGDLFTYQLNGPDAIYLGGGDLHDPKYDHLEVKATFADIMDTINTEHGSFYTGIPVNDIYCSRTIKIYPSQASEDLYTTNNPALVAILTALIFVFTSMLFVGYDCLVARRQRIVNNRAVASSAIVNSLFPEKVAKQLYEERQEKAKTETNLKSFIANTDGVANSSAPIADLYSEISIMFADLAGFTRWSANRSPADVFQMLETFYGAFDEIAKRRGVFKVETVGDCYVAVTGIPDPRKDHATCMCRFAWDCMERMNELKVELASKLGSDTLELQFRVGIHSGSVIAGVLRGEKGRFQLFGDTMNTASRMESNGVPGRIQVSEDTALELRARSKGHWLTPRDGKIVAKGKGEMQTYFVALNDTNSAFSASDSKSTFSCNTNEVDSHDDGDRKIIGHLQTIEEKQDEIIDNVEQNTIELEKNRNALIDE